jgi:hypothetical protein
MALVLTIVMWFIYNNVYIPLTRAVEIAELKETTAVVRPDSELLNDTLNKGTERTATFNTEWDKIRNPFTEAPSPINPPLTENLSEKPLDTQQ